MGAMTPARIFLLFAYVCVCFQGQTNAMLVVSDVLDIPKLAKDVTVALLKAWDLVDQNIDFGEVPIPILQKTETKLFGKIERINSKMEDLAARVENIGKKYIL